jgi:hypothetical protein
MGDADIYQKSHVNNTVEQIRDGNQLPAGTIPEYYFKEILF